MTLAGDLLEQACHLAHREPKRPRQSSQRAALGRYFQHGSMARASERQKANCNRFLTSKPPPGPGLDTDCMTGLQTVSFAFCQALQQRQTADYGTAMQWTRTEALAIIDQVDAAFKAWPDIRNHKLAQDYLLSLLGDPRGR